LSLAFCVSDTGTQSTTASPSNARKLQKFVATDDCVIFASFSFLAPFTWVPPAKEDYQAPLRKELTFLVVLSPFFLSVALQ
jgi:hypothetical protein